MSLGPLSGSSWGSLRSAITIPARWGVLVFLAWALGACVAMARLAAGLWRLRRLRQSCTPVVAAELDPAVREDGRGHRCFGGFSASNHIHVRVRARACCHRFLEADN